MNAFYCERVILVFMFIILCYCIFYAQRMDVVAQGKEMPLRKTGLLETGAVAPQEMPLSLRHHVEMIVSTVVAVTRAVEAMEMTATKAVGDMVMVTVMIAVVVIAMAVTGIMAVEVTGMIVIVTNGMIPAEVAAWEVRVAVLIRRTTGDVNHHLHATAMMLRVNMIAVTMTVPVHTMAVMIIVTTHRQETAMKITMPLILVVVMKALTVAKMSFVTDLIPGPEMLI